LTPFGKFLVAAGIVLILAGLLLGSKHGIPLLGRLPGDIRIERENFSFYFPLGTCVLISALISLAMWLMRR